MYFKITLKTIRLQNLSSLLNEASQILNYNFQILIWFLVTNYLILSMIHCLHFGAKGQNLTNSESFMLGK